MSERYRTKAGVEVSSVRRSDEARVVRFDIPNMIFSAMLFEAHFDSLFERIEDAPADPDVVTVRCGPLDRLTTWAKGPDPYTGRADGVTLFGDVVELRADLSEKPVEKPVECKHDNRHWSVFDEGVFVGLRCIACGATRTLSDWSEPDVG